MSCVLNSHLLLVLLIISHLKINHDRWLEVNLILRMQQIESDGLFVV